MSDNIGYIEKSKEILDTTDKDFEEFTKLKEEIVKAVENKEFNEEIKKKMERMFELNKIIELKHNTVKSINKIADKEKYLYE